MEENHETATEPRKNTKVPFGIQTEKIVFEGRSAKVKTTCIPYIILLIVILIPDAFIFYNSFKLVEKSFYPLVCGLLFAIPGFIGILMLALRKTAEFDFLQGVFYPRGRGSKEIPFSQIASIEMSIKLFQGRDDYRKTATYSLEAVLKDGTRLRILQHYDKDGMKSDAQELSARMSVPLKLKLDEPAAAASSLRLPGNQPPNRPKTITKGSIGFQTVIGLVTLVAGIIMFWFMFGKPLWLCQQSARWVECPAVVIHSELKASRGGKGGPTYRVLISYSYEVDGNRYTSDRYDFFMSRLSSNLGYNIKRKAVDDFPVGKHTTCLVNPINPSEAVICRDIFYRQFIFAIFPVILFIIGIAFLKSAISNKRLLAQAQHP